MTNLVVHQPVEITGNLVAHYPPKEAEVIPLPHPFTPEHWNLLNDEAA